MRTRAHAWYVFQNDTRLGLACGYAQEQAYIFLQ